MSSMEFPYELLLKISVTNEMIKSLGPIGKKKLFMVLMRYTKSDNFPQAC